MSVVADNEPRLRRATLTDLGEVAEWLSSSEDCRLWAGSRVAYPIDFESLPDSIEWESSEAWCLLEKDVLVAFAQLVPKANGRLHVARLLTHPAHRRRGFGRELVTRLVAEALSRKPRSLSLNVARDNSAAISLYRSLDFIETKRPFDEPASSSLYMESLSK